MPQVLQTLVGGAGISPLVQKGGIHLSQSQGMETWTLLAGCYETEDAP